MKDARPSDDPTAFIERLLRWQDGALSPEEMAAFERELRDSPVKRRWFIEAHMRGLRIHAQFRERAYLRGASLEDGADGTAPVAAVGRRRWSVWAPLALAACLAMAAALWLVLPRPPQPAATASGWANTRGPVATLVAQEEARWRDGAERFAGQRLPAGALRLERGSALIRFDGGARLAVVAPADLILESPGSVRVRSGQVAVQAPEEAVGFRVWTPEGAAVDLGTEFVVSVSRSGATECQVIEGEVEWHSRDGRRRVALLGQGEARRFDGGRMESVAARETGGWRKFFETTPPAAAPGELLAHEPFDYGRDEAGAESLHGGFGWRSPWRGRFIPTDEVDHDPRMRLRPGASLNFPGLAASQGGAFVFHEPKQWRLRTLPAPVDFRRDGAFYLSFLARRPLQPPPVTPEKARYGRMMVTLRSSTDYWAHWVGFAISSASQPLILADGNNRVSSRAVPSGETLLVVCKVAASRLGPDQLFLRVYEPGEEIETEDAVRWTVSSGPLDYDIAFDLLILSVTGGVAWELDELRYGNSWSAVLPRETAHRSAR
jgi:hypothetical protein